MDEHRDKNHLHADWNDNIKVTMFDRILSKTLLIFIPSFITPNHLTLFRLITIPFIWYLFYNQDYSTGTILFIFSALSDALDGALARTTKQITEWGIVFDPIADKLLIGAVSAIIITQFMSATLAFVIIFLELLLIVLNYWRHHGKVFQARMSGKIKMCLQCFGIGFLLLYILFGFPIFYILAQICLFLAVCFALISLFVYYSI